MLLRPLKRVSVPESASAELVEPSAGTATAFAIALQALPQVSEGRVSGTYFSGLRTLICLHDNGKPFLPQLVNSLNETDPAGWPITVEENVSIRQTLEDLDGAYLTRVLDYFLDNLTASQLEQFQAIIRKQLWVDAAEKNG